MALRVSYAAFRLVIPSVTVSLTPQSLLPAPGIGSRYLIDAVMASYQPTVPGTAQACLCEIAFSDEIGSSFGFFGTTFSASSTNATIAYTDGRSKPRGNENIGVIAVGVTTGAGVFNICIVGTVETYATETF